MEHRKTGARRGPGGARPSPGGASEAGWGIRSSLKGHWAAERRAKEQGSWHLPRTPPLSPSLTPPLQPASGPRPPSWCGLAGWPGRVLSLLLSLQALVITAFLYPPPASPLVPCIRQSPGATVQSGSGPKDREGPGRPWRWARSQAGCPDTRDVGTRNKDAALTEPSLCALRRLGRGEEGVAVVISRPWGLSETMTTSSLQRSEAGRRVMAMLRAQSGHTVGA